MQLCLGVLLIEGMAQTAGIAVGGPDKMFLLAAIRSMKFLRPVRPEEQIGFTARKLGVVGGLVQCAVEARVGQHLVAEGQIILTEVGRPESLPSMTSICHPGIGFRLACETSSAPLGSSWHGSKNERNHLNHIQLRKLSMKKIAIALCLGWLIGLSAVPAHAQLVVAKEGGQLPTLSLNYLGKQPELTGKASSGRVLGNLVPSLPEKHSAPQRDLLQIQSQGLQIVGITDEDEATVKKFQKQIPMDYNVAINTPGSIFEQFGVTGDSNRFSG